MALAVAVSVAVAAIVAVAVIVAVPAAMVTWCGYSVGVHCLDLNKEEGSPQTISNNLVGLSIELDSGIWFKLGSVWLPEVRAQGSNNYYIYTHARAQGFREQVHIPI